MIYLTESSALQSALPMKCFSIPGTKLSIILMCVRPIMMSTFRSTQHRRDFVESSVLKCIEFSNINYGLRYIMLHFVVI